VANTLLLYHSGYGQTRRITERIRERLEALGETAEARPLDEDAPDPSGYDRIAIGASIRNGKHAPIVHEYIRKHQAALEAMPSSFFSVNLVARKPEKNTPETNPYLKSFLEQCPWQPDLVGLFAGDLDYQKYGFFDRNIIRFIMWMTKGPTDPDTKKEYTDWASVDRYAERLAELNVKQAA
jgi:menaquinone-dependent protoporphyrinogen oxidase